MVNKIKYSIAGILVLSALLMLNACKKEECGKKSLLTVTDTAGVALSETTLNILPADTFSRFVIKITGSDFKKCSDEIIDITTNAGWLVHGGNISKAVQVNINESKEATVYLRAPASPEQGFLTINSRTLNKAYPVKFTPLATSPQPSAHLYNMVLTASNYSVPVNPATGDTSILITVRIERDTALAFGTQGQLVLYSMQPYSGPGAPSNDSAKYNFSPASFIYFTGDGIQQGNIFYAEKQVRITNANREPGRIIFRATAQTPYTFSKEILLEWF